MIFDRKLLRINQQRAFKNFNENGFLYHEVSNRLAENLQLLPKKNYDKILKLGVIDNYEIIDYRSNLNIYNSSLFINNNCQLLCDDEYLPFKSGSFDLIVSNLNLQFINEIPQFLVQIRDILQKDGVFLASFFGEENLKELNHVMQLSESEICGGISPRMAPMIDVKTAAMLLQKSGLRDCISSVERIEVIYENPLKLLQDLQKMALGNILYKRNKRFFTKKLLQRIVENYYKFYQNKNGEVIATFEVIIASALR